MSIGICACDRVRASELLEFIGPLVGANGPCMEGIWWPFLTVIPYYFNSKEGGLEHTSLNVNDIVSMPVKVRFGCTYSIIITDVDLLQIIVFN